MHETSDKSAELSKNMQLTEKSISLSFIMHSKKVLTSIGKYPILTNNNSKDAVDDLSAASFFFRISDRNSRRSPAVSEGVFL